MNDLSPVEHASASQIDLEIDTVVDLESEQALLGAIFENNSVIDLVRSIVMPEHFAEPLHRDIYEAALGLALKGLPVSPITMRSHVKPNEKAGNGTVFDYLCRLKSEGMPVFNARGYAEGVRDAWARRRLSDIGLDLAEKARFASLTVTPERLCATAADDLASVMNTCADTRKSRQYGDVLLAAVQAAEDRLKSPDALIDWFLPEMNEVIGPVRAGNLVGFMSDSGGGKTSLSLSQCRYAAEMGVPSAFLSIEVTEHEAALQMAAQRLRVSMSEMDNQDLLRGKMDELVREMEVANNLPLVIEPYDRADLKMIGATIASLKKRMGLRFAMIDHAKMIDLPGAKGDMFAEKVNGLYRGLKTIAKATGVAIVILIQRNSDWKGRDNPRPVPSDAYGGGGVMQNLDAFFSIYRPEALYANKLETEHRDKERDRFVKVIEETRGFAFVINHKRRRGQPLGHRRVRFEAPFTLFSSEHVREDVPAELPW